MKASYLRSFRNQTYSHESMGSLVDYVLLACVLMSVLLVSLLLGLTRNLQPEGYMRMFMGVFFLTFAGFKFLDLKGFVSAFSGYDIIAKKDIRYAYAYPVIELVLAAAYFFHWPFANPATIVILAIGGIGVFQELLRGNKVRCACLGTFIKLPLTTISLVEDLMMVAMAVILAWGKI
jgi:hypothetical protein